MELNLEQRKLIQLKPNGQFLIKGVAGSGKTTVAVYRIPFLLNYYCYQPDDNVLLVTFTKTLTNYIKYLYDRVNDEDKLPFPSLFSPENARVEIINIDSLVYKYFQQYQLCNNVRFNLLTDKRLAYTYLAQTINELKRQYSNISLLDQQHIIFLYDEIDWIKSCNYLELEEYQNADRLGRMGKQGSDGPKKLPKNSETRRAIFELMKLYNEKLRSSGYVDFKDMALYALKQAKTKVDKKYTHIIIDESQDLTRVQLELLKLLYNEKDYSSICFIADTAQSIYPHSWLVKGRSFASIGFDMTGRSYSLSKNYRTTAQIAKAAYSLIEKDPEIIEDENFVQPSLIDRQGNFPVRRYFTSPQDEAEYIVRELGQYVLKAYNPKDIAIIAKNKEQLRYIKEQLDKAQITANIFERKEMDFEHEGIKLVTIHSVKGLEFKVVFIIGLNSGIIPYISYADEEGRLVQETTDRKLLYVGMTRANDMLYLTCSGQPSKFLQEINCEFLRLSPRAKIGCYYQIPIEKYQFKEKIIDLFSREEQVRQWLINELQEKYKYPLALLDVEYQVNSFSKVGLVDIVVSIYRKNLRIPYIFAEVKALGRGLHNGLEQLKSYMSNEKNCQYGLLTDGNEMVFLDKDLQMIDDIPEFGSWMLPEYIIRYEFHDLKRNRTFILELDQDNPDELVVRSQDAYSEKYDFAQLSAINVYSSVAAGNPTEIFEEPLKEMLLPEEWFNKANEYFILQVKGDSMIGANIASGDMVLVQRQTTAQNRDIVVVALGEEATLKRYVPMGNSVILMPENKNYEPILVQDTKAQIIGVVIGIIKLV
ncbi:UvrD-helicase domain-containing protein [Carboxydocella sp. JDF658]|uniref:UvrD-helicase domain-containing protein n=1 Tax=Carboxydocella sp. JDF658 TaxID=1926600 RepID=UPI0009ACDD66|nr:UvrD-helicase domain-containing protein [Carboxydocella sp. JDF658]GAW32305.1 repressor LexA [Carboxydocella sp. JDF658]